MCLAAVTLVSATLFANPGHISVDEVVYHLMARSFANAGSLDILNGYQEFPAAAFDFPVTHARESRLVSQYPPLYPVLTAPFYWLAGYKGLFLFNALALVGVVCLCYATAKLLFRDRPLALNACLILVLATYAWEYSQAAWPHAAAMLFVWGALYLAAKAHVTEATRTALVLAAAAGLVAGAGVGIRIDAIFVVSALVLLFLLSAPARLPQAAAVCLGTAPALAILAAVNHAKFGIAWPFSYGPKAAGSAVSPGSYLPVLVLGLGLMACLWGATRPRVRRLIAARPLSATGLVVLLAGLSLLVPDVRAVVLRLAEGAYQLVIDLRIRDLDIVEGGLTRGPGGGMIYMGSLKKSLLQSCPYLVVLILPLSILVQGRRDTAALGLMFLTVGAFLGIFAYFAWHGGLSLNLRYLLPILPATSILAAYAWREILRAPGTWSPRLTMAGFLICLIIPFAVALTPFHRLPMSTGETVLLSMPLTLAIGIGVLLAAQVWSRGPLQTAASRTLAVALVAAFAWSGAVALAYDAPRAWLKRRVSVLVSAELATVLPREAAVFSEGTTPLAGLQEQAGIRLADVTRDDFASFPALLAFHLEAGRPVFGWFRPETWQAARDRGILSDVAAVERLEVAGRPLMQLVPKPAPGRAGAPQRLGSKPNLNDSASRVGP